MNRADKQAELLSAESFNRELGEFIDASPTPFHAVANIASQLREAGFCALNEAHEWTLERGGKYFVTRNGSSIIAFIVGSDDLSKTGMRLAGAH